MIYKFKILLVLSMMIDKNIFYQSCNHVPHQFFFFTMDTNVSYDLIVMNLMAVKTKDLH